MIIMREIDIDRQRCVPLDIFYKLYEVYDKDEVLLYMHENSYILIMNGMSDESGGVIVF